MVRVYRCESLADVAHWRNILELRGIGCHIRNLYSCSVTGEVPWLESLPELWVLDDRDAPLAVRLIEEALRAPAGNPNPWTCRRCAETSDGEFTACWNCGTDRPCD